MTHFGGDCEEGDCGEGDCGEIVGCSLLVVVWAIELVKTVVVSLRDSLVVLCQQTTHGSHDVSPQD
jgi:hypothetical protein